MSKELTPLEAFYDLLSPIGLKEEGLKRYKIIETALERLKELDSLYTLTNHNGKFYVVIDKTEFNQMLEQIKALEIIKEKKIDVALFDTIMKDKNQTDKLWSYNFWNKENPLNEEEFNLLKEVLL